jgi:hypothetical protein
MWKGDAFYLRRMVVSWELPVKLTPERKRRTQRTGVWLVRTGPNEDGETSCALVRESGEVGVESKRCTWSSEATRTMVSLLIIALSSERFCSACMPNGSLAETDPPLWNTFRER